MYRAFGIRIVLSPPVKESATLVAVVISLSIAMLSGKVKLKSLAKIALNSKPWNYALMIVGIFFFLRVFSSSGILSLIANLGISTVELALLSFLLGFGTGRIITPAGIVFPILISNSDYLSLPTFSAIYFSIFLGYILTPIHPCVSLSVESFQINMKDYIRQMIPPVLISLLLILSFLKIYPWL